MSPALYKEHHFSTNALNLLKISIEINVRHGKAIKSDDVYILHLYAKVRQMVVYQGR